MEDKENECLNTHALNELEKDDLIVKLWAGIDLTEREVGYIMNIDHTRVGED